MELFSLGKTTLDLDFSVFCACAVVWCGWSGSVRCGVVRWVLRVLRCGAVWRGAVRYDAVYFVWRHDHTDHRPLHTASQIHSNTSLACDVIHYIILINSQPTSI